MTSRTIPSRWHIRAALGLERTRSAFRRRYRTLTFALLKAEGPLPVAIDTNAENYFAGRRAALVCEIAEVGTLAKQGHLDGVNLTGGELVISPVQASTPPEAEKLNGARQARQGSHGRKPAARQLIRKLLAESPGGHDCQQK